MNLREQTPRSWFWRWFLNSKVVTGLLVLLLILCNTFVFTKVAYLLTPFLEFLAIVGLPIIMSGILYYLMNPVVDFLEKKGVKRVYSILGLFVFVIGLIVWGVVVIIPKIEEQTISFMDNFPSYVKVVETSVDDFLSSPIFSQVQDQLEASWDKVLSSVTNVIQTISKSTFQNLGSFFGALASVFVAIITMPFILFYLLRDG